MNFVLKYCKKEFYCKLNRTFHKSYLINPSTNNLFHLSSIATDASPLSGNHNRSVRSQNLNYNTSKASRSLFRSTWDDIIKSSKVIIIQISHLIINLTRYPYQEKLYG